MPCARLGCTAREHPFTVHYLRTHFSTDDAVEDARVCEEDVAWLKERIREQTNKRPVAVTGP